MGAFAESWADYCAAVGVDGQPRQPLPPGPPSPHPVKSDLSPAAQDWSQRVDAQHDTKLTETAKPHPNSSPACGVAHWHTTTVVNLTNAWVCCPMAVYSCEKTKPK